MSIHTTEDLSDLLDEELSWRRKELSDLKGLIDNSSHVGRKRDALLRCGVALLYAHWEGFVKATSSAYLEFVSRQQLTYRELTSNFVAVGIKPLLSQALQSNRAKDHNKLVFFLRERMSDRSSIPYKKSIDTGSNLSSSVFRDIVEKLGLDYQAYVMKENIIDEQLVNRRNSIAHGSYLQIDATDFDGLFANILEMMVTFRNQIDNSAQTGRFRIGSP